MNGIPTAASVSAALRRQGLNPVGSGSNREGIKVREGVRGIFCPTIRVDFDADAVVERMTAAVVVALAAAGYVHTDPREGVLRVEGKTADR